MSDSAKGAFDKGFAHGAAAKNDTRGEVAKAIGQFVSSSYKGDKDFPESYKEGYDKGKKNG